MTQENNKVLFYSKMQHPKLVMESKKTFKSDGEASPGRVIQFDHHHFETDDEEIIEFIRKHPMFGHDYVEVDARREEPKPVGKPTVHAMGEGEADMEARITRNVMGAVNEALGNFAEKIGGMIGGATQTPQETASTAPDDEETEKTTDDTSDTEKEAEKPKAKKKK